VFGTHPMASHLRTPGFATLKNWGFAVQISGKRARVDAYRHEGRWRYAAYIDEGVFVWGPLDVAADADESAAIEAARVILPDVERVSVQRGSDPQ
jgi:hypothetical protein